MKILQINSMYNSGSTGKITADIHNVLLESDIESVVCYGRGEKTNEKNIHKVCTEFGAKLNSGLAQFTGLEYTALPFSLLRIISVIKKEKPDVVHLQCINGFFVNIYALISWLKKHKIKTLLTLHAEFMFTANCPHSYECISWQSKTSCENCKNFKKATHSRYFNCTRLSFKKMSKAFEGFGKNLTVASVSPWLCERSKRSYILGGMKNITVLNGINTKIFKPYEHENNKSAKTVLHVTAKFSDAKGYPKGGDYVIALAKKMPDVNFVVVAKVLALANGSLPDNLKVITDISQSELAKLYSESDLSLITSKKETFSMPVAESLCCGTPVVGFEAGGPESIAVKQYSDFVNYGDFDALENAVKKMLKQSSNYDRKQISKIATAIYSEKSMADGYISAYKELLSRK